MILCFACTILIKDIMQYCFISRHLNFHFGSAQAKGKFKNSCLVSLGLIHSCGKSMWLSGLQKGLLAVIYHNLQFICSILMKYLQCISGQEGWMNPHSWFLERRNGFLPSRKVFINKCFT